MISNSHFKQQQQLFFPTGVSPHPKVYRHKEPGMLQFLWRTEQTPITKSPHIHERKLLLETIIIFYLKNQRHLSTILLTSTKGKDHINKLLQLLLSLVIVCKFTHTTFYPYMCLLYVKTDTPLYLRLKSYNNSSYQKKITWAHQVQPRAVPCPAWTHPALIFSAFRGKAEIGRQSFKNFSLPGNTQLKFLAEND